MRPTYVLEVSQSGPPRLAPYHQETFGGYIDGDGGVMARKKVSKLAQNIFSNQKRLMVALEGSGGGGADGGR